MTEGIVGLFVGWCSCSSNKELKLLWLTTTFRHQPKTLLF